MIFAMQEGPQTLEDARALRRAKKAERLLKKNAPAKVDGIPPSG